MVHGGYIGENYFRPEGWLKLKKEARFKLALIVGHPELSAEEIATAFDLPPRMMQTVGQPKITPSGRTLPGNWRETKLIFEISREPFHFEDFDMEETMWKLLESFDGAYTANLAETGGWSTLSVGVFTDDNAEFFHSCELMDTLARAKIRLWYDVYGGPDD